MQLAVVFLVIPLVTQATLTEVRKCFTTNDAGIKIADGQCDNVYEDSVCNYIFDAPINNGWTNSQVDEKCYEDTCVSRSCLKQCLMCCEDPKFNCSNAVKEATCSSLKHCDGCEKDTLKETMRKFCPKSCGFCHLEGKPIPEKCKDKESNCQNMQNFLSCKTDFMQQNCAETCNSPCSEPLGTSTSTKASTTSPGTSTTTSTKSTTTTTTSTTTKTSTTTTTTTTTTTKTTTTTTTAKSTTTTINLCEELSANYVTPVEKYNWTDAQQVCQNENAALTVFHSDEEQNTIQKMLDACTPNTPPDFELWIGLKRPKYHWIDGTANWDIDGGWDKNRPNECRNGREQCTLATGEKFMECSCNVSLNGVVCEKKKSGNCLPAWTTVRERCFLVITFNGINWSEAQQYCEQHYGGTLASFSNMDELVDLKLPSNTGSIELHYWIGLHRTSLEWVDGTAVSRNYETNSELKEDKDYCFYWSLMEKPWTLMEKPCDELSLPFCQRKS